MIWIQSIILLGMILVGSRMKGIGLGVMGIVGMLVFVFLFHMRPAEPPLDVMLIILAIVTTAATLQAAGGLDYLVGIAERIIRSRPAQINFIGPLTAYVLCLFAGTSHVVYSLLPIVAEVAAKKRIRPERPLSMTVVASHVALTGSPMSAATAALATLLVYPGAQADIMKLCIPVGLLGVMAGCISVLKMGRDLNDDPLFIEKMKDPEFARSIDTATTTKKEIKPGAKNAVAIFGVAILLIILFGAFPTLIPMVGKGEANLTVTAEGRIKMGTIIEIITLSAAALIMGITGTTPKQVSHANLFTAMAAALVSVFGIVWMSSTFMLHNQVLIQSALSEITRAHPWTFTIAVFIMGALMFSQSATTKAIMPLGIALGISSPHLMAMFPAVNSDFVLPGYPTLLAAIQFDRTGSTHIGKFVLNHSFIRGGIITVAVAVAMGFLLSGLFL